MKIIKLIMMTFMIVQLSACATLLGDSSQEINVSASNGQSFEGQLSDGTRITAPGSVNILKKNSGAIKITTDTEGCNPITTVDRRIEGAFWGNIISGGVLGSGTDYITGKMWNYDNAIVACQG